MTRHLANAHALLLLLFASGCGNCACTPAPNHTYVPASPVYTCQPNVSWTCPPLDGSTATCFQHPTADQFGSGVCAYPCTAWSEAELVAVQSTADRVCLGIAGSTFDPSLAGTMAGGWMQQCFPGDPEYRWVTCTPVQYGNTTVSIYLAAPAP